MSAVGGPLRIAPSACKTARMAVQAELQQSPVVDTGTHNKSALLTTHQAALVKRWLRSGHSRCDGFADGRAWSEIATAAS